MSPKTLLSIAAILRSYALWSSLHALAAPVRTTQQVSAGGDVIWGRDHAPSFHRDFRSAVWSEILPANLRNIAGRSVAHCRPLPFCWFTDRPSPRLSTVSVARCPGLMELLQSQGKSSAVPSLTDRPAPSKTSQARRQSSSATATAWEPLSRRRRPAAAARRHSRPVARIRNKALRDER